MATGWQTVAKVLAAYRARRAPRIPRAGPRARVLSHLGRARMGRVDLPAGPSLHRRLAVAGAASARALRRVGHVLRPRNRPRALSPRRRQPQRGSRPVLRPRCDAATRRSHGLLALEELQRRRPRGADRALFGEAPRDRRAVSYRPLGVLPGPAGLPPPPPPRFRPPRRRRPRPGGAPPPPSPPRAGPPGRRPRPRGGRGRRAGRRDRGPARRAGRAATGRQGRRRAPPSSWTASRRRSRSRASRSTRSRSVRCTRSAARATTTCARCATSPSPSSPASSSGSSGATGRASRRC